MQWNSRVVAHSDEYTNSWSFSFPRILPSLLSNTLWPRQWPQQDVTVSPPQPCCFVTQYNPQNYTYSLTWSFLSFNVLLSFSAPQLCGDPLPLVSRASRWGHSKPAVSRFQAHWFPLFVAFFRPIREPWPLSVG